MPENFFSPKMKAKSIKELEAIVASSDFSAEARQAAQWELDSRNTSGLSQAKQQPFIAKKGEEPYEAFLKTVKTKKVFAWTPRYQELIKTELSDPLIFSMAEEIFEKLDWELAYYNGERMMALKKNYWKEVIYKIHITPTLKGSISVVSESTKGYFDRGQNSKNVKLFIHVFNETLKTKSPEELADREAEIQKKENWDDYEVPAKLPKPAPVKTPNPLVYVLIGLITITILSFLLAYASSFVHIIFLYEVLIGIGLAFMLVKGIRWSNFIPRHIQTHCIVASILITLGGQFFTYLILLNENPGLINFNFIDFMSLRLEQGFTFRNTNLGWYGWIAIFILQPFLITAVAIQRVFIEVLVYVGERVPREVVEFATYHFVKGKTEQGVRTELSMKGWSDKTHQDYVFEAIGGLQEQQEVVKELS